MKTVDPAFYLRSECVRIQVGHFKAFGISYYHLKIYSNFSRNLLFYGFSHAAQTSLQLIRVLMKCFSEALSDATLNIPDRKFLKCLLFTSIHFYIAILDLS